MAVGCSHGNRIDPIASEAALRFKKEFKPHTVIHLGDFMDTACLRSGARGTPDESEPLRPDIEYGLDFIEKLGCSIVLCGNHEDRLWALARHSTTIIAELAGSVISEIELTCQKIKAELVPYHVLRGYREVGGYKYLHGYWYNINAARDAAESYGNCVFAHTHTTAMAKGRRLDNPTGFNVGTLTNIPNMDYATKRRQTMAWSQSFLAGEYAGDKSQLWLVENGQNKTGEKWRLPV